MKIISTTYHFTIASPREPAGRVVHFPDAIGFRNAFGLDGFRTH
jgi:hypothetical protein